ncbi:BHLH domain-containing protein [Mycena sanguinolenta]|uniref:BHLH domain-containing protein n=1 Tax=Mycena sanguinolenta TaxID=230812 RepID=A0A8H7CHX8_9AGAR|nr:BHLH domain-containing protein [Mycena sanguinolenta]
MSSDLVLDPTDHLNLLFNQAQHDGPDTDTDSAGTPPDWNSTFSSSMWPVEDQKMDFNMDNMDFGIMDMPFDPAVGIEPNALINYPYTTPEPFPFTFESPNLSSRSSSDSGSTSGSFSPRAAYSPPASEFEEDPATELANRALKAAGVVHAVPINQEQQRLLQEQQKLLQQQQQQQQQQQVQQRPPEPPSYSSPPPAFTTTPVPPPVLASTPVAPAAPSRPKTSHTTIERRYRTNLNARIQSLRQAVPALRVVDRAAAIKAGEPPVEADTEDIVDARGFVDGVKVARKCSKANVLGKAVEPVSRASSRGLKTLLTGLVGGRELLEEWEREWTVRFGGPETDEVSESGAPADAEADEGDDDDDESDEEGARKRKKPKVDAKPKPERKPAPPPAEGGEKKKRGRPRKVVPPPSHCARTGALDIRAHAGRAAGRNAAAVPPRRLRAVLVLRERERQRRPPQAHHAHEGHVLTHVVPVPAPSLGLLQIFHLLVSIAVLASVLLPIGRSVYSYARGNFTSKAPVVAVLVEKEEVPPPTPTSEDESSDGDTDLSRSTASISGDDEPATPTSVCSASASAQAAAEACILDAATTLPTRLRTALKLYSATRGSPSSPPHADTDARRLLALLVQPVPLVGARVAAQLWGAGSETGMDIQVDEAARRLCDAQSPALRSKGVLRALEETLALERLRGVAAGAFAREVLESEKSTEEESEKSEQALILAGARKLGGRVGVLAARVGRVLGGAEFDLNADLDGGDSEDEEDGSAEDDVEKLLRAIVLHRRVFVSPSAVKVDDAQAQALRRTLGSSAVFEDGARVEEARDRVVDLLTGQGER